MSLNVLGLSRFEKEYGRQHQSTRQRKTSDVADVYKSRFSSNSEENMKQRNALTCREADKDLVQDYYAIATDLYEYGWGSSFHFGVPWKDSSFEDAIRRYEYYLPMRMKVGPGDKLLDLGCGVGGPMRNISRFSGTHVTGVNISEYQVYRANVLSEQAGLSNQCVAKVGDFTHLDFEKESFDGVYAIEATCHTNDKNWVYGEAFKVLKPGGYFAGWEWVTTDAYDPDNEEHRSIRFGIEKGSGLPETVSWQAVVKSLEDVGFIVEDHFDASERCEIPWYSSLSGVFSLTGFARTPLGFRLTTAICKTLEFVGLLPKGVADAHQLLVDGAKNLVAGGEKGICT